MAKTQPVATSETIIAALVGEHKAQGALLVKQASANSLMLALIVHTARLHCADTLAPITDAAYLATLQPIFGNGARKPKERVASSIAAGVAHLTKVEKGMSPDAASKAKKFASAVNKHLSMARGAMYAIGRFGHGIADGQTLESLYLQFDSEGDARPAKGSATEGDGAQTGDAKGEKLSPEQSLEALIALVGFETAAKVFERMLKADVSTVAAGAVMADVIAELPAKKAA